MEVKYLFSNKSRWVGLLLIILHVPVKMVWHAYNPAYDEHRISTLGDADIFSYGHVFYVISTLLILTGLFLIAFSKEKTEDEQISQLRLHSLRWAIYFNYLLLILSLIFTNGINFIDILRLDILLPLVFFILHFQWVLWRLNRYLPQ